MEGVPLEDRELAIAKLSLPEEERSALWLLAQEAEDILKRAEAREVLDRGLGLS